MNILSFLTTYASNHDQLVYLLIGVIAFVEGHIITLVCGFLARLGLVNALLAGLSIMIGNLTGDTILYWLGRKWGEPFVLSWGKYLGLNEKSIATVKRIFDRHHRKILLGSKLTNGLGFAVAILFTAGMIRIPFLSYLGINLLGEFMWTGSLLVIGFFYGNLYLTIDNIFFRIFMIALVPVAGYGVYRLIRHFRAKIAEL